MTAFNESTSKARTQSLAGQSVRALKRSLEEELIELLGRQASRVPFPVFIIALVLAGLAASHVPAFIWAPWLAVVAAVLATRWYVIPRLATSSRPVAEQLRIAVVLSAINGCAHGASLYVFPVLPEFEQAIQTLLLTGLCTGAVVTTAGYRPVFLAYLLPIFVPLFFLWLPLGSDAGFAWVRSSLALMVVLFGLLLAAMASDTFRLFRDSFQIRLEQSRLNEQLREALGEADVANKAKMRFLASASHDLRQPLHTLSLYSAALTNRPLDDRSRAIAENMKLALQSLGSQLDALLDISRLDAGVVEVRKMTTDLDTLFRRIHAEFSPEASEKGLQLMLDSPDTAVVDTDETLLERILVNLLSNAIKYTSSGVVTLQLRTLADTVHITVSDTGMGIPAEEHRRVFDEFYQIGNPHRDRSEGFGLGLSIVSRLADLLGIALQMESAPGQGTRFTLQLPRSTGQFPDQPETPAIDVSLDGLHILAVDDEAAVREGMKILLEGLGCTVDLADGTDSSILKARAIRPDIMVVDFRLRDGDNGLATVHAIREIYPGIPVLMISGDTAPDRLREANAAGIDLLHKPVAEDKLKMAIAAACTARI